MTNVIDHKFEFKKNIHMKKFNSLIFKKNKMKENKNSEDHQSTLELFQEWEKDLVKNYTNETFTKTELDILQMGLKMSFVPTKTPLEEIIVGIESGIKKINFQNQDIARK